MHDRHHDPILEWHGASFAYGAVTVVEDVTLQIAAGEFAAILGPNGSGKSTLIKLALGLERPFAGTVRLFGRDPLDFGDWDRVGYVPQVRNGIWNDFPASVAETVSHGSYRGFSPKAIFGRSERPEVIEALEAVGMAALRRRRIAELSVGQQQRVLLARALIRNPELLVLDEPTAGVDVSGEEQLYTVLRDLNRLHHTTIVLVSHDIGAMLREASTVACMNRRLVLHGPAHELTGDELSHLYGVHVDVLMHDALHEHR